MLKHCLPVLFLIFEAVIVDADSKTSTFAPSRISFEALLSDNQDEKTIVERSLFQTGLSRVGLVSVTGVFAGPNKSAKDSTLASLHHCVTVASISETNTFPDGTVRRTLPTHSIPNGIQEFHFSADEAISCQEFSESSYEFRKKVEQATTAFAKQLSAMITPIDNQPLLKTKNGYPFVSLADIIENGEHLEHFHSYQKQNTSMIQGSSDKKTIEWHTDQGLFLVFTPGRRVQYPYKSHSSDPMSVSNGFYIQQEDGTQVEVEFDEHDDLVFLLGDGVNQYINSKLTETNRLRAVPHALVMPDYADNEARVWYGRMVLPPADAIHPHHGVTFHELRERANYRSSHRGVDNEAMVLACSAHRRVHEDDSMCGNNTLMCWHRCMDIAAFNVSDEICAASGLVLNCTNPRGQLWDGNHGDFFPGCLKADAPIATPYPELPNYPRDNTTCTNATFDELAAENDVFDHEFVLPQGYGARLVWSVVDGAVNGKLVFNGLFGWIAIGFANPNGTKNGMHGGHVLMALPGGNYSAVTGLDLSLNSTIDEFHISENEDESSFRFWMDPITSMTRSTSGPTNIYHDDCNTALSFNLSSIGQIPFNLSGEDDLIWGANGVDYFAGYHGNNRGRFYINWAAGTGRLWEPPATAPTPTAPTAPVSAPVSAPTTTGGGSSSATSTHRISIIIAATVAMSTLIQFFI